MKHYVIFEDWYTIDSIEAEVNIIGVAHSLEEAKQIFNNYLPKTQKLALYLAEDIDGYGTKEDLEIWENTELCFYACAIGNANNYYTNTYVRLCIEEVLTK